VRGLPKNPRTPPLPLSLTDADLFLHEGLLWRIHATAGEHPSAWDELRRYGPLTQFRWEPHPPPPRPHRRAGVSYAAADYATAFAEVFQRDRAITLTPDRALTAWLPTRPLRLLDLIESGWLLRHRASASLPHARRDVCRSWAAAVWEQLGTDVDGIRAPSTVLGHPVIALLPRAGSAFPAAPEFSRNLAHHDVATLALRAARGLGWAIW
jgi:hypothetical protein